MAAQLIVTEPSGRTQVVSLNKGGAVSIGRGTDNGVVVVDPLVSRRHCTITWDESGISIEDHDSENGTRVNAKTIRIAQAMHDRDEVCIGHCRVRLITIEPLGAATGKRLYTKLMAALMAVALLCIGTVLGFFAELPFLSSERIPAGHAAKSGPMVKSAPPGAMVFLDNDYVGITPLRLQSSSQQSSGEHSIRLSLAGYQTFSKRISMTGGDELAVEMQPIQSSLIEVTSEPSDAEVLLDGNKVGSTPLTVKTVPGVHQLVLQKTNYVSWKGTVEAEAGKTVKVAEGLESRAVLSYLKQIEEDPNNLSFHCELGHIYIIEKRWAEAYDILRKAMEIHCTGQDTSNPAYAGRMQLLFDKIYFGDYFEVDKTKHAEVRLWIESLYADMIRKYPSQRASLVKGLTDILKRAGRLNELDAVLKLGRDEPNLDIYFQAANVYIEKGQYNRAVGVLSQAVNLGPNNPLAYARLGEVCIAWCRSGRTEMKQDAVKNLEKALTLCNDELQKKRIESSLQEALKL